jgi:hypothetical protein
MTTISLPKTFSFWTNGITDFDNVLGHFQWQISDREITIELDSCHTANYQTLALLVPYIWKLKIGGTNISINSALHKRTPGHMWSLMGARGWSQVLYNESQQFTGTNVKPLLAIRNQRDFGIALSKIEDYTRDFNIEYEKTLRYVVSELLYNTLEHGPSFFENRTSRRKQRVPSIIQFTWYKERNELSLVIADTGIGIKQHLEQAYPPFEDHASAIQYALKPQVSGTFGGSSSYQAKNNAGVGLFISSNIVRKLHADMFIVSGDGLVHVSPMDVTSRTLAHAWPGTVVLINLKLSELTETLNLQKMMSEFRQAASSEIATRSDSVEDNTFYVSFENFFGRFAEDKQAAINFRTKRLLPAIDEEKTIILDFSNVEAAPHSFLSALLAIPIRELGNRAYKRLKFRNANTEIRETLDFILDENVPD